jgi:hypothetical protein
MYWVRRPPYFFAKVRISKGLGVDFAVLGRAKLLEVRRGCFQAMSFES